MSAIGLRSRTDVTALGSNAVLTSWTSVVGSSTAAASLNSGGNVRQGCADSGRQGRIDYPRERRVVDALQAGSQSLGSGGTRVEAKSL